MWLWAFGKAVILPWYRLWLRFVVEGREHVPVEGGLILCSNHIRAHDPGLVGMFSPRPVIFMAKEEIFKVPVIGWLVRSGTGAFPVRRGTPDRAALKRAADLLESGGCLGIFPEGTRTRSGRLGKAEPGTAYLALKTGAKVVPVGISGTYKLFSRITIRFGPPVDLSAFLTGRLSSERLNAAGEEIMTAIAGLVEPEYR